MGQPLQSERTITGNCGVWCYPSPKLFKTREYTTREGGYYKTYYTNNYGSCLGITLVVGDTGDIPALEGCVIDKVQTKNGVLSVERTVSYGRKVFNGTN